ncbi:MAG: hypothetical protein ACYDBN_07730 [Acidimicrobiales bacterium]
MVLGTIATAVGTIMYSAITYLGTRPLLSPVRLIPMIVGAIGFVVLSMTFVVSTMIFAMSKEPRRAT